MATTIARSTWRLRRACRLAAIVGAALLAPSTAPVEAQQRDRTLELDIARELMELELAGWRLPDPVEECLSELALQRLEPMAFGAPELIEPPALVDPPGPHFRALAVGPEAGDPRRLVVRFEWVMPTPDGRPEIRGDFLVYVINEVRDGKAAISVVREPQFMVVRRECFGG
jgi:hypothetical protein